MNSIEIPAKADIPAHVPPDLVYDFDYNTDPAYCSDPHARAEDLLKTAPPIFWSPYNNGHWIIQKYDACYEALRDAATFSSEHFSLEEFEMIMASLPEDQRIPAPVPISVDPPLHTKLRQPLFSTFSPKTVAGMEKHIRALAERLVDALVTKGHCEFQHDVSDVYPVEIFLEMFGLPVEKEREYRELAKKHLTVIKPDIEETMMKLKSIADVMRETIIDRRENPRDDIISMLWSLEIDGEPMRLDLIQSYCVILFVAGLDTVVNALGFGVRHLATDPGLQRELRANPELIRDATEEMLRRYAFVAPMRKLKKDVNYHGVQLGQGDLAMLFLPSASVDADAYTDPTTFNARREKLTHMTFGAGPHVCLGANLARMELRIMFETLLRKLPEFRLDPNKPPTFHGSIIAGPSTIHLVWDI
jgi:cytochrome P450